MSGNRGADQLSHFIDTLHPCSIEWAKWLVENAISGTALQMVSQGSRSRHDDKRSQEAKTHDSAYRLQELRKTISKKTGGTTLLLNARDALLGPMASASASSANPKMFAFCPHQCGAGLFLAGKGHHTCCSDSLDSVLAGYTLNPDGDIQNAAAAASSSRPLSTPQEVQARVKNTSNKISRRDRITATSSVQFQSDLESDQEWLELRRSVVTDAEWTSRHTLKVPSEQEQQ